MASSTAETLLTQPVVDALNTLLSTTGKPPQSSPKKPSSSPFGFTYYTCLPSRTTPATYECVKDCPIQVDKHMVYTGLTTRLGIQESPHTWKFVAPEDVETLYVRESLQKEYLVCYNKPTTAQPSGIECVPGKFKHPFEEGKPYILRVPTFFPNHQSYASMIQPNLKLVPAFSTYGVSAKSGT